MASLTTIAVTTRRIIRYGIFFILFLIVIKLLFDVGKGIYRKFYPAPPPAPTVSFGKLDKLPFPDRQKINLSFTLETPEGGLPTLPVQAKVFYMPKQVSNLLALDVSKDKAESLGFSPTEQEVSQSIYRFQHKDAPATLEINIISGFFSISYDLKADPSPLERKPPAPEIAASTVRSYLSSANLLPEDLTGQAMPEYLKIEGGNLVGALSLSDSDLIRINLFRKNYEDLPSVTAEPNRANVWFIVSGAREREKQIIAAEYHYFPVDSEQSSTYPLKTSQVAWDELTAGNVYVASYGQNKEGANVKIRRIYLAYFDPGRETQFYQPVITFEGDGGFVAYTPAVIPDYYGE